jgi:hypothetical protein
VFPVGGFAQFGVTARNCGLLFRPARTRGAMSAGAERLAMIGRCHDGEDRRSRLSADTSCHLRRRSSGGMAARGEEAAARPPSSRHTTARIVAVTLP